MEPEMIAVFGWLGGTSVALLVAWGRIEVRLQALARSNDRLWKEFDALHPRTANPGHRIGVKHDHKKELEDG